MLDTHALIPSGFGQSKFSENDVRRWAFAIAFFAIGVQIVLVWSVNFPPLHDAPNHMARHFLESEYLFKGNTSPFYTIDYKILPNLGGDLVIPPLLAVFSPVVAFKVFLSLAVTLYWVGPALFIWQYGNYSAGSMAASLLLLPLNMSSAFFWGFLNYYTGVGLAFLVLVHFIATARRTRPAVLALLLHAALVTLLFFWHLAAVLIYGVVMAAYNAEILWDSWRSRTFKSGLMRAFVLSLPIVPSLFLYGIYAATKSTDANYWGTWLHKFTLPFVLFRTYSATADVVVGLLWLLACVAFFGLLWRGQQKLWLWIAIAAFAFLTLAVPVGWGSTFNADARLLPPLMVCILAAAGRCELYRFGQGACILLVALLIRYGSVYWAWSNLDVRLTQLDTAFQKIPAGSRVMTISGQAADVELEKERPENVFAAWLVPLRGAFVPGLYAYRDQQPLVLKRDDKIYARLNGNEIIVDEQLTRANYDFVWIFNPGHKSVSIPNNFKKIFEGDDVMVWRVPQ